MAAKILRKTFGFTSDPTVKKDKTTLDLVKCVVLCMVCSITVGTEEH